MLFSSRPDYINPSLYKWRNYFWMGVDSWFLVDSFQKRAKLSLTELSPLKDVPRSDTTDRESTIFVINEADF